MLPGGIEINARGKAVAFEFTYNFLPPRLVHHRRIEPRRSVAHN